MLTRYATIISMDCFQFRCTDVVFIHWSIFPISSHTNHLCNTLTMHVIMEYTFSLLWIHLHFSTQVQKKPISMQQLCQSQLRGACDLKKSAEVVHFQTNNLCLLGYQLSIITNFGRIHHRQVVLMVVLFDQLGRCEQNALLYLVLVEATTK